MRMTSVVNVLSRSPRSGGGVGGSTARAEPGRLSGWGLMASRPLGRLTRTCSATRSRTARRTGVRLTRYRSESAVSVRSSGRSVFDCRRARKSRRIKSVIVSAIPFSAPETTLSRQGIHIRGDVGFCPRQAFGNQFARCGGHGKPQHVVARGKPDVRQGGTAVDDGQSVAGHGPPTVPFFQDRLAF